MKKLLLIFASCIILSCKKDVQVEPKMLMDNRLTISQAKEFYEKSNSNANIQVLSVGNESNPSIAPHWEKAEEMISGAFSLVEIPISMSKKEVNIYQLNGEKGIDNIKRAKFSFSRLLLFKNLSNEIKTNIITYIPDVKYITNTKQHLLENNFKNLDPLFTGYIEFKNINGIPYKIVRIANGKPVQTYKLSTTAVKTATQTVKAMSALDCNTICTPRYGTFCFGPAGPGTGFDEDMSCETKEIGETCYTVCTGGDDNGPTPGDPDPNPVPVKVFGLNGSNAIVPKAKMNELKKYVRSLGLNISESFETTLTVDGVDYKGSMTEIYDGSNGLVASYFTSDQTSGLFDSSNYYSIGSGAPNSSAEVTIYFAGPSFIGEYIGGGGSSITNQTVRDYTVDDWSDTDSDRFNDPDAGKAYPEYQDPIQWPNKDRVIPFEKWVGFRRDANGRQVNCLVLAKEQLATVGFKVSGYDPTGQTFQIYTSDNGVNLSKTKQAISYMIEALNSNKPILVGIDNRVGAPRANPDNSTDHFVVIDGAGKDQRGKYFHFLDSSTDNRTYGASYNNKLYYNEQTGKISGTTQSRYGSAPGAHEFIVTQVRKSIVK